MISTIRRLAPVILLLLLASTLNAQTHRASLRGTVSDPNGALIQRAQAKLINRDTGETRTATSGDSGEYTFSSLQPGLYRLEISAPGFATMPQEFSVSVNQEKRVDAKLEIAAVSDPYGVISTTSTAGELKKDSSSIGTVIENRQIVGLPLDGRNFYELTLLVPGAAPAAPGSAGSIRGDFAFSVNGAREDANNFLLDGTYNVDPKLNTFGVRPSVDAIHEFEMLTSSYDAAFGRAPGAQVNVVLKSGGNRVHGSLFEFYRNGALDARNFFAPANESKPKYLRNQFGGSFGGPIKQDRTFFFGDYEGTRAREGITRITNVPTALERGGDFSQSLFGAPVDPFTGMPFSGGLIPGFRINAVGRAIAALYPLPNRNVPLQNFVSSPTQNDNNDSFDVRIDNRLTDHADLTFR